MADSSSREAYITTIHRRVNATLHDDDDIPHPQQKWGGAPDEEEEVDVERDHAAATQAQAPPRPAPADAENSLIGLSRYIIVAVFVCLAVFSLAYYVTGGDVLERKIRL